MIESAGFTVDVKRPQPGWLDPETREKIIGYQALIAGGENLNAETMDRADDMLIIARNGVGYDKVDLDYCTERGIIVTNTPGAMADAVADQAFALLLGLSRQLVLGDARVKKGDSYDIPIGEDLTAMTLGLFGCGHIGAEVIHRALGFKMRVLVHDPWIDGDKIRALGAEPVDRETLLAQSDAITLHVPLTEANQEMVNGEFLGQMKKGSYLVNTARGGLVDEAALIAALKDGHLAGAGLDCQATEPPQGQSLELVRLDSVLALPHSGSKTLAARKRMAIFAAEGIIARLQGKMPNHVVNKAVLEKLDLAG
jgi:D-3-phosphoglycerate dehydrogenase